MFCSTWGNTGNNRCSLPLRMHSLLDHHNVHIPVHAYLFTDWPDVLQDDVCSLTKRVCCSALGLAIRPRPGAVVMPAGQKRKYSELTGDVGTDEMGTNSDELQGGEDEQAPDTEEAGPESRFMVRTSYPCLQCMLSLR